VDRWWGDENGGSVPTGMHVQEDGSAWLWGIGG